MGDACGSNKRHMILILNLAIDDTLIYLVPIVRRGGGKVWVPMESLKRLEGSSIIPKKKKDRKRAT